VNIRKPTDYSDMYTALDWLMTEELPHMELYREIGGLVNISEKCRTYVSIFKKSKNYCKPWMLSGFRQSHLRFFNRLHAWSVLQSLQYQ